MDDYNSALKVGKNAAKMAVILEPYSPFLVMKAIFLQFKNILENQIGYWESRLEIPD